jgi:hypothetical protein
MASNLLFLLVELSTKCPISGGFGTFVWAR